MSEQGSKLKAAILIVSETASKDHSSDKCIPVLKDVFGTIGDNQWELTETGIVPDDVVAIQKNIRSWTDGVEPVNLIVTSGGTGFAIKDVTPEVRVLFIHVRSRSHNEGSDASARPTCSRTCVSRQNIFNLTELTSTKPWHAHELIRCYTMFVPPARFLPHSLM